MRECYYCKKELNVFEGIKYQLAQIWMRGQDTRITDEARVCDDCIPNTPKEHEVTLIGTEGRAPLSDGYL